jgi:protein-S-isoprenylcysteine O-methyltransferase Ste14
VNHNTKGSPAELSAGTVVRLCQAALNIIVLILFALLVVASYHHVTATRSLRSLGILTVNTLFLGLFLARRRAAGETPVLSLWLLGVAGTAMPLLLRPSDGPGYLRLGTAIQLAGIALVVCGLLSLRRSFAVVPGNRGIREGGLYQIVRHPIYISELVALLGVVLVSPTPINWALWIGECGVQFARARAEEKFLSSDPVYRAYRERVRYRLIPGLI